MSEPVRVDLKKLFSELKQANAVEDKPSKEWFTTNQLAEATGIRNNRANVIIRNAVKQGSLEVKMFKVKCGQVVRPVPHYRKVVG